MTSARLSLRPGEERRPLGKTSFSPDVFELKGGYGRPPRVREEDERLRVAAVSTLSWEEMRAPSRKRARRPFRLDLER